ncbi:MAG: alpha/beta hydrolase [Gammaproteobacteria bacterium]|nr:MAG: alpha/beta hydrolase [Gammaproteobacteria bacterium]
MNEHVILLHGLWMRGFTLAALRRRLEREGYAVDLFDYASVLHQPEESIGKLIAHVQSIRAKKIHYVGHSLGGLMALRAVQRMPRAAPGCVVCLGSPLRGSAVARSIAQMPGGSFVIGKSLDVLLDGLDSWNSKRPVGVMPFGLGLVLGALPAPHDGTVSVEETQLPGLTDHCIVAATHTGLLFSDEVASQTISFLRDRRFVHQA